MKKTYQQTIITIALLILPAGIASALTDYTETFATDAANWRITDSVTPMTWVAGGGPAGEDDAYVSNTNVNFSNLADGSSRLAVRGHASFNPSGGAFIGNWLSNSVFAFSIDVRHHLGVPARIGARIATPANNPGASIEAPAPLPSGQWATLIVPVDAANPGFISFGSGNFTSVFSSVGNIQINLYAPTGFGGAAGPFTLDIDNVSLIVTGSPPSSLSRTAPDYDRWMYPFSGSSPLGNRPSASTFGTIDPDFDNRDAQAYFGFILTNQIPPGLGPDAYEIATCRFLATMSGGDTTYDPTQDTWTSYLSETQTLYSADTDAGRPMELFGAGWRNGFTPSTYGEDGPFAVGFGVYRNVRNVYAMGIHSNQWLDVSNSLDPTGNGSGQGGFDPIPFAIGQASITPGDVIPLPTTFSFDIQTGNPLIQDYLQEALDQGILGLVMATLHPSSFMGPATFPVWDQKESFAGDPATLEITYRIKPGLSLGIEEEWITARWSLDGYDYRLETSANLVNGPWIPQTVLRVHGEDDYRAPISLEDNTWFIRLQRP